MSSNNILGMDLIEKSGLIIDCFRKRIIFAASIPSIDDISEENPTKSNTEVKSFIKRNIESTLRRGSQPEDSKTEPKTSVKPKLSRGSQAMDSKPKSRKISVEPTGI